MAPTRTPDAKLKSILNRLEWAMARNFASSDLEPMLKALVAVAPAGSDAALFGHLELAKICVHHNPWRAARLAQEVLRWRSHAVAWGLFGLALSMLGHYRSAVKAYRSAVALSPDLSECQHNLGHLLDVALGRPFDALPHLKVAYHEMREQVEVASSYAHALVSVGQVAYAQRVLEQAFGDQNRAAGWIKTWQSAHPP